MVLDVIVGAILVAFGILTIYFSIEESGEADARFGIILIIGLVAFFLGAWLLISKITLALLAQKITGLVMMGIGFFLIVGFPGSFDYQEREMGKAGIFIGVILFIVGVYLFVF